MRRRWLVLWLLIVGVLGAVEIAIVMGLINPNPLGSIFATVFALTIISILAIIGAVFVGMFASHRILSTTGFTPFEQEMLRMREDLRELHEKVGEIAARLGVTIGNPKNPP
jgi:hypothetical protein